MAESHDRLSSAAFRGVSTPRDTPRSSPALSRKHKQELPQDMWGVSIFVIVKDVADICARNGTALNFTRVCFSVVGISLNILLQVSLVLTVRWYILFPALHRIQSHYEAYHRDVFTEDGSFVPGAWVHFPLKKVLCDLVIGDCFFLSMVLFLWTARMVVECKDTLYLVRDLQRVPRLDSGDISNMVVEEDGKSVLESENLIVALDCPRRVWIYTIVVLPRFCISCFLWYQGTQWLTATERAQDLLLNALALEFIIHIDEIIYDAFFPRDFRKVMENTKFMFDANPTEGSEKGMLGEFAGNFVLFTTAGLLVVVYYFCFQTVLPGFLHDSATHCANYFSDKRSLLCGAGERDCFPFGGGNASSGGS